MVTTSKAVSSLYEDAVIVASNSELPHGPILMTSEPTPITKTAAAERLLDASLSLWFAEGDPLAVHVLAASAHQIIHDLNTIQKCAPLLFDSLHIKEEFRHDYINFIKRPWNFLKHADRDAEDILNFREGTTVEYLMMSIQGLRQLGQVPSKLSVIYYLWLMIHHPDWLISLSRFREKWGMTEYLESSLRVLSRRTFLEVAPNHIPKGILPL